MKVLCIIPSYLPAKISGGVIGPTHDLNRTLVERGIEVVVYTTNLDGKSELDVPLNRPVILDGVKVFCFPITYKPWQYSLRLHLALIRNVKYFDLIHISSVFLAASTLGSYYSKKFKKPYIISPHGCLMKEPLGYHGFKKRLYLALFEKRNLAGASAIHFTVEKEKAEYLDVALPVQKAIIIPYCIRIDSAVIGLGGSFREKHGINSNKKIILFLSRINWKKGLDTLIPAFAEVLKKEHEAVLVIAGPDEKNYKKEVILEIKNCKLKIGKDVIFTGMVLGEDKIASFRDSDVFVLPSYSENLGMAVVEAMVEKLPVIITKGVGISKVVEATGAGLVVEKEVSQVAEAILTVLNNPGLAERMGERGRELVEKEFSCDKITGKFINEYNKMIQIKN